jgi:PAS domain S-box-containing protein
MHESKKLSAPGVLSLLLLFGLGLAGNYFKLSLFYGFDFLFGGIFLMILLSLFGVAWGVVAALLASSCTYLYWHHPYGIIVFSLEILVVGLLIRRKNKNLVLSDGLFWLCVGTPLNWILYFYVMKSGYHSALLVVLKQAVNGIFNTLVASIILDYLPIQNWFGIPGTRRKVPIQQALFHLILAMILFPALATMIINSRKAFSDIESGISHKLQNTSVEATYAIDTFIQRHLDGVRALADTASRVGPVPSADLQDKVKTVKSFYPDFHNMYVANAGGVTVAFYPEKNEKGESTIGIDFSDRAYYAKLKSSLRPVMSDVFMGRGGVFLPIVTLSVPILERGRFNGFALGAVDLNSFKGELERITTMWGLTAAVLDERDQVIAATSDEFRPLQIMDWRQSSELRPMQAGIYRLLPPVQTAKSAFDRWKNSYYVMESPVGKNIPWKVLLAAPVAPYQKQLYETTYINNFSFMLVVIAASIVFSVFLSRRLVSPFEKLESVTTDLPSRIALGKTIDWPDSILFEIHSLVGNFKVMTSSLTQMFRELNTANESLQDEIANHRRTEECLADEKERLSVTLLSIGDGVISTDTDGRVVLVNKVAEELLEVTQDQVFGRHLPEVFRTFDAKNPEEEIHPLRDSFTRGSRHVVTDDVLLVSRNGAKHIVSTSFGPIRNRDGGIVGGALVFRDNTERRKIEEKLQNAQKLESIGVLAGGIAHDFNNLLSAIIGNISLAKAGRSDAVVERLQEIETASMRARDLTRQLLTFSKGGAPIRKTASISELIRESATFVTRGSNVRCAFHIALDLRPVEADEGQLSQVINNLVINAMQAMPDGGVIRIIAENIRADAALNRMGLHGDVVKVSVHDDGPGIPAENVPKIFDPYFTTKASGSGLGLATVYSIVKRHDGQIEMESRSGAGTTFHCYLPASDKPVSANPGTDEISRNGKGKILVMDDEDFIRSVAGDMLSHLGYGVVCAKDGAEAIELYVKAIEAGNPFDAVIMDLTIPGGMGGKEAIVRMKEIDPGIMAIVSSGYSNNPILADPANYGFAGIVTKPYTLEALSGAVRSVLGSKMPN